MLRTDREIVFHKPLQLDRPLQQLLQVLRNSSFIYLGKLEEQGLDAIFPDIREWKCDVIYGYLHQLGGRPHSHLLKQIANIRFPCLAELNLSGNGIGSVEVLPRVFMPELAKIDLRTHHLTKATTASAGRGACGSLTGLSSSLCLWRGCSGTMMGRS